MTGAHAAHAAGAVLDRHPNSLTTFRPTSPTPVQGVLPNVGNRAVQIDGGGNWPQAAASSSGIGKIPGLLNPGVEQGDPPGGGTPYIYTGGPGEPGGGGCGGGGTPVIDVIDGLDDGGPQPSMNGVDLVRGALRTQEIDIAMPAPGFAWRIARSYSAAQGVSGSPMDSNGHQGRNWFQDSQPEILFYNDATDSEDMVYIVWGAAAYSEFQRVSTSNVFKGKNGTSGLVEFASGTGGEPDTWTFLNASGVEAVFFASGTADRQLWKITDAAGNCAHVGHKTTASSAVSGGYSSGRITTAYDSADRRYTYDYDTIDSTERLVEVKAETRSGGTWASPTGVVTVAKVNYSYYAAGQSDLANGEAGNLKLVKVTTPLSDSGVDAVSKRYFRYFTGSYDGTTNRGQSYLLRHVIDAEGSRRYDPDDADLFAATDSQIKPYAMMSFEYDSSRRIDRTFGYGQCGCGGGSTNGVSTISYDLNGSYSDTSGYDTAWKSRAVVSRPDGTWLTQYIDEVGLGTVARRHADRSRHVDCGALDNIRQPRPPERCRPRRPGARDLARRQRHGIQPLDQGVHARCVGRHRPHVRPGHRRRHAGTDHGPEALPRRDRRQPVSRFDGLVRQRQPDGRQGRDKRRPAARFRKEGVL